MLKYLCLLTEGYRDHPLIHYLICLSDLHPLAAQRPTLLVPSCLQAHSQLGTSNCQPAAWEALPCVLPLTPLPSPQLPL